MPRTLTDEGALNIIAALLDENEWDADVFDMVAAAVRETGRTIADTEPEEETTT